MTMTVGKLHRLMGELIAQGHARKPVCINKDSFSHPLESECAVILGVECVKGPEWIRCADEDGGIKTNADGTESGRLTVILEGGAA